jgi:prepilin-type N-terminal cleavage/methylation domain-containing protein
MRNAFTLIELILVMVILAIAAAMIVPSLISFAIGRATDNASTQILNLSTYARTQAISEGRTYRLNFDPQAEAIWLTAGTAGVFAAPVNDFGARFSLPQGIKMDVDVTPQPNTELIVSTDVQQIPTQIEQPFGQPLSATANNLIQIPHTDGTYVEFQPSGRTDPVHIKLTDKLGKVIDLGLATSTDVMHVLSAGEMQ